MSQLTPQQTFELAVRHHQAGRLTEAEQLYRQVLASQAGHADAWHRLGGVLAGLGRRPEAVDAIRRALALQPHWPEAHCNLGNVLRDAGQLDESLAACRRALTLRPNYPIAYNNLGNALKDKGQLADAIAAYRQALALNPTYAKAYHNLGIVLLEHGQADAAIAAYRQAIALNPGLAEAHNHLANVLKSKGLLDEALAEYRHAIALKPAFPEAHNNLGNILKTQGHLAEAIAAYRQVIALNPHIAATHTNLGNALCDQGHLDEAIAAYRQAIAINPNYAEAYSHLGNALQEQGQLDAAIAACQQAITLNPNYAEAYGNLGNALKDQGQLDAAVAAYRQAIALRPTLADAYYNLGIVLHQQRQLDAALATYQQAAALRPDHAAAHSNRGNVLKDMGELDQALAAFGQAQALKPHDPDIHSSLLLTRHYLPDQSPAALGAEARRWNSLHAAPLQKLIQPHANDRSPDRRLRIGYVSPDFVRHPVGRFLEPLLACHDHHAFEIFAYAQVPAPDEMTARLRSYTDAWRSTVGLSHAQVAEMIQADRIDILVDLAMHSAHNRLLVFARKPAPVQVTYLAYCSTTGLDTIDYRLSDPYLDPPGMDESIYSERTVRLPETYWCYQPRIAPADVGPLPALAHGHITFGCLNNFCKVSAPTFACWTSLLRAVPHSRLILHAHQGAHRQRLQERWQREGLDPTRLHFADFLPVETYFALYRQIDIALDTFPYGGGTTTCDALWMGVPVVTLAAPTAMGRAGLSLLSNLGLPELVAQSPDEYVHIAATLATDLPRLAHLRASLRPRMEQSPLMDAPRFTRHVEAAYRHMWKNWATT